MWRKIGMLALGASLIPLGACAQNHDGSGGPSPEMRTQMDAARGTAKSAAFAALSDDHRAKVQGVVDAFDASGSALTVSAAASQIDAILSKDESNAALDQEQKMRDAMRAAFASSDGGPGGGAPGGYGGRHRTPDAGRFLLSVDADQTHYREAMRAERHPN